MQPKKILLSSACVLSCALLLIVTSCNDPAAGGKKTPDDTTTGKKGKGTLIAVTKPIIDSADFYSKVSVESGVIEKFIAAQHIEGSVAGNIRSFYNYRSNQLAWFNDSGFTEQALAFRSLYDYDKDSLTKRTSLDNLLDQLMNSDSLKPVTGDPQIMATELMTTWRMVNYMSKKIPGVAGDAVRLNELVPYTKHTINDWISFMKRPPLAIDARNKRLAGLQKALQQLTELQQKGGWDSMPVPRKLPPVSKPSPLFKLLKKRLFIAGQLKLPDTTPVASLALMAAVKAAQAQYGYPHDSTVTKPLLKALNIPVAERIRQVIVNMARMQWMPEIPGGDYVLVNIPEYRLYVMNNQTQQFGMDVITGKQGHSTVMFSGKLNQIVFSPYWNLPPSIVKKEVLPKLQKNKRWLAKNKMEIKGHRKGLPVIRQLPGERNELGKIKFLFPNNQNIYFHDTPHKWLFSKDIRAYSHGCIRLAEPDKLANFLLVGNSVWTTEKIDSAMNSGKEKYVLLAKPVPVLIYYFTAWVDDIGVLQFRNDIYGHDAEFEKRLFRL